MRALRAVYWLRPPATSISALVLAITFNSSLALPLASSMPSLPNNCRILALSSSVLFLVLVAATCIPKSCAAEIIDQLFTPPVYSTIRLPWSRAR